MNVREIRNTLGLNQVTFWHLFDVTQSGGSRYESGRPMPKPLARMIHAVVDRQAMDGHIKLLRIVAADYRKKAKRQRK